MLVDDCRILGDREQPLQQRFAFIAVHAFDPHRVLAGDVERFAARARIGDEDRLRAVMGALERQRHVDAAADAVLLALHDHGAVEPPLQIGRQVFVSRVHAGELRVTALGRNFEAVQERRAMRLPMVALVGVKPHFAVSERTERLAVGVDVVADHHHVVPH